VCDVACISRPVTEAPVSLDNVGDDCPVFDGLFDYCSISAGGSMGECIFSVTSDNPLILKQRVRHVLVEINAILQSTGQEGCIMRRRVKPAVFVM